MGKKKKLEWYEIDFLEGLELGYLRAFELLSKEESIETIKGKLKGKIKIVQKDIKKIKESR